MIQARMIGRDQVTLGILAGGRASRLGGVDKALVEYRGRRLLERTLEMAGDGYIARLVSHPGERGLFHELGLGTVPDLRPDFPGPLAGIEALLARCTGEWLLTLPVDLLDLPANLCEKLLAANPGQGAFLHDGDGPQPLVCLWPVLAAKAMVKAAMDHQEGAVHVVVATLGLTTLDISPLRIGNLNSPSDFD